MHSFRAIFLALVGILFLAGPALATNGVDAGDLSWNQLTHRQKAELALEAADMVASNQVPAIPVKADDVAPWLALIDRVGEGLVKLARDLGVTANELLASPVGVITVGLVAYHIMGAEVVGVLCGLLWFFLTLPLMLLFFYKLVIPVQGYESRTLARSFGRNPVTVDVPVRREVTFDDKSGPEWVFVIVLLLQLFVTICFVG